MNLYIIILLLVGHMSTIPYVSQEGEGADKYRYDCGPANVSMMIENYTDVEVSPDVLMDIIGSDRYTFSGELQYMMGRYKLKSEIVTFKDINEVIARSPVIILTYHHWILITGEYEGQIRYHDSLVGRDQLMNKETMQDRWKWSGMPHQGIVVTGVLIPVHLGIVQ